MNLNKTGNIFYADCDYSERDIPKAAGFRWHGGNCYARCAACAAHLGRVWWTPDLVKAAKLGQYADESVRAGLVALNQHREQSIIDSRASDADIDLPVPDGLAYMPFQRAGIKYALARPNTLFGDEMGLGKTIQAIGVINADASVQKVLVICPATLKLNWQRELSKWLVRPFNIGIINDNTAGDEDILIVNYDRLKGDLLKQLVARRYDLLIGDECHYCFPAGTLVSTENGDIPIETIVTQRLPVSVWTCDLSDSAVELKPVDDWLSFPAYSDMVRVTHEFGQFECTADHRIWTEDGYIEASALQRGTQLRILRSNLSNSNEGKEYCSVLQPQLRCAILEQPTAKETNHLGQIEQAADPKDLRMVPTTIQHSLERQCEQYKAAILLEPMRSSVSNEPSGESRAIQSNRQINAESVDWQETARCRRAYASAQSDEQPSNGREDAPEIDRTHVSITGRQRPVNNTADVIGRQTGVANGISNTNRLGKTPVCITSADIRSGYCRSGSQASYRDRRAESYAPLVAFSRQTENRSIVCSRVVGVEILKRRSDERHKQSDTTNSRVYCLGVAENNNFFADGVLVSNCKNPKTRRTQAVLGRGKSRQEAAVPGLIDRATRKLMLTGTPILNKPIELQPIAGALAPADFGNFWAFAQRYCDAHSDGYGWKMDGSSHLDELQERLRASIMVRRLKKDVLKELPAKRRQIIELQADGATGVIEAENAAWKRQEEQLAELQSAADVAHASGNETEYKAAVARLRDAVGAAFSEIARLRHETALAKVPAVIEHIENVLESQTKLVVFGHHHDVLGAIAKHFAGECVVLTGETKQANRMGIVDTFQNNPRIRVFIGSTTAAGVGITLTAASHVVFAELDWVPANITQAEDRTHRIGQTESVLIQHIVLDGSLDARMAKTLVAKQEVADKALDKQVDAEPAVPIAARASRPNKYPEATQQDRTELARKLQYIAGICDGARRIDGFGFNKYDAAVGKSLAERSLVAPLTDGQVWLAQQMLRKYTRQLEGMLVA